MTTVLLYGHLGRTFGHRWRLDVHSPAEAVRAIIANRPDFQRYLIQHSESGYRVVIGDDTISKAEGSPEWMQYPNGRQAIKIVPAVIGGKEQWINIVIGAVIIAAAIVTFQYEFIPAGVALAIGGIGATLVLGGVTQLLAGTPEAPEIAERPENKPSFVFSGPVNTTAQGHPVPVGYGMLRIGSAVISASIIPEDLAI